jgi:cation:H+ antiporter
MTDLIGRWCSDSEVDTAGMRWLELVIALGVILAGAELFTNGVESVGEGYGLSEGAVGSVLAAIGTALPETLLPIVAVLSGHEKGDEIGVGAILGAPFMLSTLAMAILGLVVVVSLRRGRRSPQLRHDGGVLAQDLAFFLVMYSLATFAGLLHVAAFNWVLAAGLIAGYGFYVRRHFSGPGEKELEAEAAGEVKPLHLRRIARRLIDRAAGVGRPTRAMSMGQTAVGLGVILLGARLFVSGATQLASDLHVSHLAFALLVAPVATELPEAFNSSVIWARRGKDTLALGNLTGAMVFQSVFPVTIGLLLTPWRLQGDALVAAIIALVAGGVLFVTAKMRGRLIAPLLILQGVFYVGYVAFVLRTI